ncbi:MAG: hypothetical protein Q7K28_03320 [Candidatus Wildermuthbacteria bacterium]|nr:hypothetical protein [Candidatus Wildermuthbacteria bacterium]
MKKVFQSKRNIILVLVLAFIIFLFFIWLPNIGLISRTIFHSKLDSEEKLIFLFNSLAIFKTNFSFLSGGLTFLVSILFGINAVLVGSYVKKRIINQRILGVGFLGIVSGFFGGGCAACGSIILSSIFGTAAIFGFPLHGQEFGILAVIILLFSIFIISQKINGVGVGLCNVSPKIKHK